MNKVVIFILLASFGTIVSGCGVKPSTVKPPKGQEQQYNRTYPAPNTVER